MRFYKFCLFKAYFDKGLSLMAYPTKALMVLGIGAVAQNYSLRNVVIVTIAYALFCFVLGKLWFKFKIVDAEHEVMNNVNPFVREMRSKKFK